jgi:hypothetical protein
MLTLSSSIGGRAGEQGLEADEPRLSTTAAPRSSTQCYPDAPPERRT